MSLSSIESSDIESESEGLGEKSQEELLPSDDQQSDQEKQPLRLPSPSPSSASLTALVNTLPKSAETESGLPRSSVDRGALQALPPYDTPTTTTNTLQNRRQLQPANPAKRARASSGTPQTYHLSEWTQRVTGNQTIPEIADRISVVNNAILQTYAQRTGVVVLPVEDSGRNMIEAILLSAKSLAPDELQGISADVLSIIAHAEKMRIRHQSQNVINSHQISAIAQALGVRILVYHPDRILQKDPVATSGNFESPLFAALAQRSSPTGNIHYDAIIFSTARPKSLALGYGY